MSHTKFNTSEFDDHQPTAGHELRFGKKLNNELHQKRKNWILISAVASIVLLFTIGFYQWNQFNTVHYTSTKIEAETNEFPLKEAENFYENSFEQQLAAIAGAYKGLESKQMIEESLLLIKELQAEYKTLEKDFKHTGDRRVATAMILNYKSRITILEKLVEQLEFVNQLKNQKDEKISA